MTAQVIIRNGDIENIITACIEQMDDCHLLSYENNKIYIGKDFVRIVEDGEARMDLLLKADGMEKAVPYDTAYGLLEFTVMTKNIKILKTDRLISVIADYCISDNRMELSLLAEFGC